MRDSLIVKWLLNVTLMFSSAFCGYDFLGSPHVYLNGIGGVVTGENELMLYQNPGFLGSPLQKSLTYSLSLNKLSLNKDKFLNCLIYTPSDMIGSFSVCYDANSESIAMNVIDPQTLGVTQGDIVTFSYDTYTVGWGHSIPLPFGSHSAGINVDLFYPMEAGKNFISRVTVDLGYLYLSPLDVRAGFVIRNILANEFRAAVQDSQSRYIPKNVQFCFGLGYTKNFSFNTGFNILTIIPEASYRLASGELDYRINGTSSVSDFFIASEFLMFNTIGIKPAFGFQNGTGLMTFEYKVNLFNHIALRCFIGNNQAVPVMTFGLAAYELSNTPQLTFGLTAFNLLEWSESDIQWWKK